MRGHDLERSLVFGTSASNRASMANLFWLSNHLDLHHCYLVAPLDDGQETALYTGLTNHVPNAREVSDVPTVEWGGYDPSSSRWRADCASSASNGAARPRRSEREILDGHALRAPRAASRGAA